MSARLTIHDTGRRFYASTAEAFKDAEYAYAGTHYKRDRTHEWVFAVCVAIAAAVGLMAAFGWLPGGAR